MPRKLPATDVSTNAARRRLKFKKNPYWFGISAGHHIGYRVAKKKSGTWVARYRKAGGYREHLLGSANDFEPADGLEVFSFSQAQDRAREWFKKQAEEAKGIVGPYTVNKCLDDYLDYLGRPEIRRQS